MATVATLKTEIDEVLGLTTSEEEVIQIFNECLQEDLVDVLRLEEKASTDLTEENNTAYLPNNMYQLLAVKLENAGLFLQPLSFLNNSGVGYKIFGNIVEPQGVALPDTLTIYYLRFPGLLTDVGQEPDMPAQYHHILKDYFILNHYIKDEEPELFQQYYQRYHEKKARLNQSTFRRAGSIPRRIQLQLNSGISNREV